MTQEQTLVPVNPLEESVPDSPAPEQPVEEQPAPESGPEEQPPEGEPAGAEAPPEPTPWASITEASAVLEHDDIRPHHEAKVKEAETAAYDKAYGDVQGRLQPIYERNREALDGISTTAGEILTQLRRAREDNVLDQRAVEDLFARHGPALAALRGVQVTETVGNVLGDLAQRIGFTVSPATHMGYQDWKGGKSTNTDFLNDFVADMKRASGKDLMTKAEAEEMAGKRVTKALDDYKAAQAASQQVQQGKGKGPNIAPGTPAGGLPMSYEAYLNRTPEQDAAMSEADHRRMFEEGVRRHRAAST